jgi:hypothetical protein
MRTICDPWYVSVKKYPEFTSSYNNPVVPYGIISPVMADISAGNKNLMHHNYTTSALMPGRVVNPPGAVYSFS